MNRIPLGPVTKWLCIALLGTTLLLSLTGKGGLLATADLAFSVPGVLRLQLWRLVTYPFVESSVLGLLLSLLFLYIFGGLFEMRWGSRDFLRFFMQASVGAAALAVPLSLLFNLVLPFRDLGMAYGPHAALDALIVALAITQPNSEVLMGFVLPVKARTILYWIIGFEIIQGIMGGAATLSITLGGMAMGYLLVTGNWRWSRLSAHVRLWGIRRRRSSLRVVRPGEDKTLH